LGPPTQSGRSSIVDLTPAGSDVLAANELVGFAEALRRLRAAANLRRADEDQ
jgi:hypothetical protein